MAPTERKTSTKSDYNDDLVRVARKNDTDAFARLFDFYGPRLKSFYIKRSIPADIAEDLIQEVFVIIWNKASMFNPAKANAAAWIYTIARNKSIDYFRKDNKRSETPIEFHDDSVDDNQISPEENVIQYDMANRIHNIVDDLPEDQKKIIRDIYYQDMSQNIAAKHNNIPLGTVKSRTRLALNKLKRTLNKLK